MFNNTPKLMKASEWAQREFTEASIPQNRTIKAWILKGKLHGKIIDNKAYVFENQYFGVPKNVSDAVSELIAATR